MSVYCRPLLIAIQLAVVSGLHALPCAADTVPSTAPDSVPPPEEQTHVVHVRFTSDDENAMLQQRSGRVWKSLCRENCDTVLSTPSELRVAGNGVASSAPFTLGPGRSFQIDANTAPGGTHLWGWAVLGGGAILVGTGAFVLAAGVGQSEDSLQSIATVELVTGGVGMLIGLLLLANSTTDVAVMESALTQHPQAKRRLPYAFTF